MKESNFSFLFEYDPSTFLRLVPWHCHPFLEIFDVCFPINVQFSIYEAITFQQISYTYPFHVLLQRLAYRVATSLLSKSLRDTFQVIGKCTNAERENVLHIVEFRINI